MVHSKTFLGHFTPIPIRPLPKNFSLQIYTDLKNGPESWKKVKKDSVQPQPLRGQKSLKSAYSSREMQ